MTTREDKPGHSAPPALEDDITVARLLRQRWRLAVLLAACVAAAGIATLLLLRSSGA